MTSSHTPDFSLWDPADDASSEPIGTAVDGLHGYPYDPPPNGVALPSQAVSGVSSARTPTRRTALGSWALGLAVLTVFVAGASAFLGLESVDVVSVNPLGDLLMWFTVLGFAGLLGCAAAVMALVALVRGGARLAPALALATVLLAGPLATYTGLMAGLDDVKSETTSDVATLVGDSAVPTVVQALLAALERTGG